MEKRKNRLINFSVIAISFREKRIHRSLFSQRLLNSHFSFLLVFFYTVKFTWVYIFRRDKQTFSVYTSSRHLPLSFSRHSLSPIISSSPIYLYRQSIICYCQDASTQRVFDQYCFDICFLDDNISHSLSGTLEVSDNLHSVPSISNHSCIVNLINFPFSF